MATDSQADRDRFYNAIKRLRSKLGVVTLSVCHAKMHWPRRGVYFFFEAGEFRRDGVTPRVVRVGTHALRENSKSTLWQRMSNHRGSKRSGAGNHRGSVFRMHVGRSLLARESSLTLDPMTWAKNSNVSAHIRAAELHVERRVSLEIGRMPVLWVCANDQPGPKCNRSTIETHAIRLLSATGACGATADLASPDWLGQWCPNHKVRDSNIWNVRDTQGAYDPAFLGLFDALVEQTEPGESI